MQEEGKRDNPSNNRRANTKTCIFNVYCTGSVPLVRLPPIALGVVKEALIKCNTGEEDPNPDTWVKTHGHHSTTLAKSEKAYRFDYEVIKAIEGKTLQQTRNIISSQIQKNCKDEHNWFANKNQHRMLMRKS
jgi:hypothetical protein